MRKRELKKALAQLPIIMSGTVVQDHQIIETDEEGCHYKITKEVIPLPLAPIFYMLSVSGPPENRRRLISTFIKILGPPLRQFQIKGLPQIEYVSWDARKKCWKK